jgi:RNA polymerase sigma-70 factor (ECF subfamily)
LGDAKAQEYLFRQFYGYVMSISLRFASCRDHASEITNDAFLKIFTRIETHQAEKEFKGWIRRIVINTAIDHFRRNRRHEPELSIDHANHESADESVLEKLNAEEIIKLIHSLPMIYRYTFILFEVEGFRHDEIADQLGVTVSTSRSNLTRAKKMLRKMILTQYHYERVL